MNNEIKLDSKATNYLKDKLGGGSGIEYIDLVYSEDEGNLTQEQITKLQNGAFVKLYQETEGDPILMSVAMPVSNGNYATSCVALDRPERTVYYTISIADDTYRCFTTTLAEAGGGEQFYTHYIRAEQSNSDVGAGTLRLILINNIDTAFDFEALATYLIELDSSIECLSSLSGGLDFDEISAGTNEGIKYIETYNGVVFNETNQGTISDTVVPFSTNNQ